MSARRRVLVLMLGALAVAVASGCTAEQSVQGPSRGVSFAEQLRIERDTVTTDFERQVLDRAIDNGTISAADYEEAVGRYLECTARKGYNVEAIKQPNGIYRWEVTDVTDDQAYLNDTYACAQGTTMIIEGLYKMQTMNPDGLDLASAALACLSENGVVDGTYTIDDFNSDVEDGFSDAPFDATGELAAMCLTSLGFGIASG